MRFYENGPDIPAQLIAACEEGRVVFFCGAGVSVPAGFPNFLVLTRDVMRKLGVPMKSDSMLSEYRKGIEFACSEECPKDHKLTFSFDQVFYLLQQEYGLSAVEQEVSSVLKTKPGASTKNHKTILRLSKNINQKPQVVTTNFDLLFESAQKGIKAHIPPGLPDISSGQPLDGVVYLHGRRNKAQGLFNRPSEIIISSADFGRAYLADGWANRFIKQLASQYVIVLLGYSAEDPPVRYLLEGLHTKAGGIRNLIYTFDRGSQEIVDQRWQHRGVQGIAFTEFDDLWKSLDTWADFAEDPNDWQESALALAQKDPRDLTVFERGEVVNLISSPQGSELFYLANPPPKAEWLCVLDPYIRNAKPETIRAYESNSEDREYLPQELYGLEDDPFVDHDSNDQKFYGIDYLSSLPGDGTTNIRQGLAQVPLDSANLSARLRFLGGWIGNISGDPLTLWWIAGKSQLHPQLLRILEGKLKSASETISSELLHDWGLLLEQIGHGVQTHNDFRWYKTKEKIKTFGWSPLIIRELESAITPHLEIRRGFSLKHRESGTKNGAISRTLAFPAMHGDQLEVPHNHLPAVLSAWRNALIKGANLALEIPYFSPPKILSETESLLAGEDASAFLKNYIDMFQQLTKINPKLAKKETFSWPKDDLLFFPQLKILAWLSDGLFTDIDIGRNLIETHDDIFWNSNYRQKIIELLTKHWPGISTTDKKMIERRLISGPPRKVDDDADWQKTHTFYSKLEFLGGMSQAGCSLSNSAITELSALRLHNAWSARIENGEFRKTSVKSGWVRTNKDPSSLLNVPLEQVTYIAQRKTKRNPDSLEELRPFSGLVKDSPLRALRSLALDAKKGIFPSDLWNILLAEWPAPTSTRLSLQLSRRLLRLPTNEITRISHSYSQWMEKNLPKIFIASSANALNIWDGSVELLLMAGDEATKSELGHTYRSGKKLIRSHRTRDHAINAPLGHMTQALFDMLSPHKADPGSGLPSKLKTRLDHLLSIKTQCVDHVINHVTVRLDWLFWIDPEWTTERVLPLFDTESEFSEPAWNGRLHDSRHFSKQVFHELKNDFLKLFSILPNWNWGQSFSRTLHQHLVLACLYGVKEESYLSFEDVRGILQTTDDAGRAEALRYLASLLTSKTKWRQFGKKFFAEAWPRELRYLSSATTNSLLRLTEKAPGNFPEVVKLILPMLTPVQRFDTLFFSSIEEPNTSTAIRYPDSMLTLLDRVLDENSVPPYRLGTLISQITESKPELAKDRRLLRLKRLSLGFD